MSWRFCILVVAMFVRGAFAAGLVVPQDGIAFGEVQPGEGGQELIDKEERAVKGLVERTDPAHPQSPQQKYRLA